MAWHCILAIMGERPRSGFRFLPFVFILPVIFVRGHLGLTIGIAIGGLLIGWLITQLLRR